MKILFVHYGEDWIAGSEVALLEMLRGFARTDITPHLWCNAPTMQKAAQAIGIPTDRSDFSFFFNYTSPPFSLGTYRGLIREGRKLIAQTGADLVHCNSAAPTQWMLPASCRARVPLLVNLHSPYLRRSRYVLGLHLADRIVAVTDAITKSLLEDGMEPARISVVHNGFDGAALMQGSAIGLRSSLGIPPQAVVGAIAGSLIQRKGHDVLFAAMKHLDQVSRPFHLLIIGEGPKRDALEQAAAGLPVHFLGHRDDLGATLRDAADFLVLPSREEAFGRVIIEAAFAGIPAIGSDVDGIPEAILHETTGLLVPPEAPAALADAIARLISDEPLRRRLGLAAQQRAAAQFSIQTCTEQMLAEYRATLQRYPAQRCALLDPRRLKPYWTLLSKRSGPTS